MANDYLLTILKQIHHSGKLTRRDIAERLDMSFSLACKLTSELTSMGLITNVGRSESEGGRPADLFALNPKAGYMIGLEIESTFQKAVVVNLAGEIVSSLTESTQLVADREIVLNYLESLVARVLFHAELQSAPILGLGVGLWALVDSINGTIDYWTESPGWSTTWKDFPLRQALVSRFSWHHVVIDDIVRMFGLAEANFGNHRQNDEDFLFVLADSGIGMAIMINDMPYIGESHIAGELGHITIGIGTTPCGCGNTGCLETLVSTNAILERVYQRINESPYLETTLPYNNQVLTILDVIKGGESGDKLAYQILTQAGEYLGKGLALVLNLLGPQLVVVGGILATSHPFLDAVKRMIKLQALNKVSSDLRIVESQLGELAGACGAASQVLFELFQPGENNIISSCQHGKNNS